PRFPQLADFPAEPDLLESGVERARREPVRRRRIVVSAGRDVVRTVRVEERGEVLDLAAAGAELELPAAVEPDSLGLAAVVELEQPAEAADAGRLHVEVARRERQRLDVRERVDRRVPADPPAMRLED